MSFTLLTCVASMGGSVALRKPATSSNAILDILIQFTISFTNQYVNRVSAPLSLAIQSGVPYYWAVLLDNTNFGGASWTAYTSSNITANLGAGQGWHTVWVGLCGPIAGSQATWNAVRLDLDVTAPILVVTNNTSVAIPMIQLQGYANEELAWLTYDLNNAKGSVSNQQGFMTGAIFDTKSFSYTNNSFKCFDLVLASGANVVTLHAADLAGNCTNCTVTFNLNYSNKPPPVIQLYWPTNGAQISGCSFTWRGAVDDPTVNLSAEITDTNGDLNVVAGVIERNGNFWVDNIPLAPGPNSLILTATDINGNSSFYYIDVVQSSVALNVTGNDAIAMQSGPIGVSGTIDTAGYSVWVNGVAASLADSGQGYWNWTANNVPVNGAGTAVLQACAIPNSETNNLTGGGGGTNSSFANPGNPAAPAALCVEANAVKLATLVCANYHHTWTDVDASVIPLPYGTNSYTYTIDWSAATGGSSHYNGLDLYAPADLSYGGGSFGWAQWGTDGWGTSEDITYQLGWPGWTNFSGPSAYLGPTNFDGLQGQSVGLQGASDWSQVGTESAATRYLLYTGGRSLPGAQSLWRLTGNVQQILDPYYPDAYGQWMQWAGDLLTNAPYQDVSILGQTEDSDGGIWTSLFNGEHVDVTPCAVNVAYYTMGPGPTKYVPLITINGTTLEPDNDQPDPSLTFSAGQQITFAFTNNWSPSLPPRLQTSKPIWSFGTTAFVNASNQPPTGSPAYSINTNLLTNQTTSIWPLSLNTSPTLGTVNLSVQYTLANSTRTFTATTPGYFNIQCPIVTNYTSARVGADVFNTNSVGNLRCNPWAHFEALISSSVSGVAGVTQLISGYESNAVTPNVISGTNLDNAEFYNGSSNMPPLLPVLAYASPGESNNVAAMQDAPQFPCNGNTVLHLDFTDFIRFKPDAGNSNNNIFVTLAITKWHIYATANTNSASPTNYVIIGTPDANIDFNVRPTTAFPVWSNVLTNQSKQ